MSRRVVLGAAFSLPIEAQLARGRLEAEGIPAFLSGDEAASVFSGIQGVAGQVRLHVAEADAERAASILAALGPGHSEDDDAADDAALWVCPICGDAVSDDLAICPSCETARPPSRKSPAVTAFPKHSPASQEVQQDRSPNPVQVTADTPLEAVPSSVEDDLDLPDMETFIGDDIVRRAFLSALFGPVFPLITLYSFWLLGRLALYSGKVSPRMTPKLYGALAINVLVFAEYALLYVLLFGRFTFR